MTQAVSIAQSGNNNVTMRNRIINGGMVIDQRNAGASVTLPDGSSSNAYPVDRWKAARAANATGTGQQSSDTPTGAGFANSMVITNGTGVTATATSEAYIIQCIEGYNVADLGWGTASAKPVTISFWVKSSITGTHSGALNNSAYSRSYPFTYTISAANTWEQKSVTVAGDTSGTWLTTNGRGICIAFNNGAGSNFLGAANTWGAAAYYGATGSVALNSVTSSTWYVTGVQLEAGTTATPFEQRLYGTELQLCQRYYQKVDATSQMVGTTGYVPNSGNVYRLGYEFPVYMRATPTVTLGVSVWDGVTVVGSLAFSGNYTNNQRMDGDYTVAAGLASGKYARLFNGTLQFSAEL
jgi:hypothetical protein